MKKKKKKKKTHENSDCRSLIYGTRVPKVQVHMETDPGYLELPSTRTDFHGLSLFRVIEGLLCSKSKIFGIFKYQP